jgi:hypothetical protein
MAHFPFSPTYFTCLISRALTGEVLLAGFYVSGNPTYRELNGCVL